MEPATATLQKRVETRVLVDEADFYHDKMQFATQKSPGLMKLRVILRLSAMTWRLPAPVVIPVNSSQIARVGRRWSATVHLNGVLLFVIP
jgi:hypothetical protein